GRAIFHHRPGAKWTAWGENMRITGFPYEAVCMEALRDLARQWDGRVTAPPAAWSGVASEADVAGVRHFLYCRVGADGRRLECRPDRRIGEGRARCEQTWRLEEDEGELVLAIMGEEGVACRLARCPDGIWRGRWLHHERMPIELVPLGPEAAGRPS